MFVSYILIVLAFDSVLCFESNLVKVNTSSGLVEGKVLDVLNTTVNQFLGIPFAEPPLASLRFAKPEPLKKPFNGIIDATKPKNSCIQSNSLMKFDNLTESEDCLVLNIWSPELSLNKSNSQLKPVMFWIYGGGFSVGSIFQLDLYDGRVLATHDVVVVSANYRLGVFGFLYGGEESAPGNVGLYDQVLALKWVKQNIHLFGGNPDMITLFGESAGSFSVSSHILSPISRNLFQRAILQSGAAFSMRTKGGITAKEALTLAKNMSKSLNCSDDNQWLDCLRKLDAKKLKSYNFNPLIIMKTEFLPQIQEIAFKNGKFNKGIEVMAGINKDEGSLLILGILRNLNHSFNKNDALNAMKNFPFDPNMAAKFYLSNIDSNNETALKIGFADLNGDIGITCPTYFFAEEFAKNSPNDSVFFYRLTHKQNGSSLWGCDEEWMGVCHGSDIPFVFGLPLFSPEMNTEMDINFSKLVMKLWTNFAKTGKPLPTSSTIEWPSLISSESPNIPNVMELNPKNFGHIMSEPFHSNCEGFWKQYLYELSV